MITGLRIWLTQKTFPILSLFLFIAFPKLHLWWFVFSLMREILICNCYFSYGNLYFQFSFTKFPLGKVTKYTSHSIAIWNQHAWNSKVSFRKSYLLHQGSYKTQQNYAIWNWQWTTSDLLISDSVSKSHQNGRDFLRVNTQPMSTRET